MYGIRAEFILELLKIYGAGFTLLGDDCQAIYDYQSDSMSSKEFYNSIEKTFNNVSKIEFKKQKRLSPILDQKSILLRAAIKSKDEKVIANLIHQVLQSITQKSVENIQEGVILTRKNGKVYDISSNLEIKHNILDNSTNINYPSWIGYLLGDYPEDSIEIGQFENRIIDKLHIKDKETIIEYWKYCKMIEAGEDDTLDIEKLHNNMIVLDNINIENLEENEKVVVSTIHKAKGKEFGSVYLDKDIETRMETEGIFDYAKLLYVAITRAKENCYEIEFDDSKYYKTYYCLMPEDRYIEYTRKPYYQFRRGQTKTSIKKIEIGLEKDIDKTSFINENIVGNVQENIEYIQNNIQKGDCVDLILENDNYYIYHNKRKIGKMNIENLYEKAQKYLNKVKQMTYKPDQYIKVKVKRINSIAMFQEFIPSEIQNIYAKTGMWIGIELEGFGEVKWLAK